MESDKHTMRHHKLEPRGNSFPRSDHKVQLKRRAQRHYNHKTEKNINDPQKKYRLGTVSKNILLEGSNKFHGANLSLDSDVDQDTFGKVIKHNKYDSQEVSRFPAGGHKATRNIHGSTTHINMKHT